MVDAVLLSGMVKVISEAKEVSHMHGVYCSFLHCNYVKTSHVELFLLSR